MARRPRVLAMIMAGGKGERLHPLTRDRSKPAVPFGGRHRIIDFVLSNFINSSVLALYVLVQYKSQSLIEHVRLSWRTTGIVSDAFVTIVPPQMRFGNAWYRGTADAVLQNLNLIDDFAPDVIAVFGADHIYRMDVNQMLAFHLDSGAEVTVAARPVERAEASAFGVIAVDGHNKVIDWVEKNQAPDVLIASKVTAGTVVRTRPLCPYPQVARYKGQGSIDDAANDARRAALPDDGSRSRPE